MRESADKMVWGFMMEYCVGKNEQGKDPEQVEEKKTEQIIKNEQLWVILRGLSDWKVN